MHKLTIVVANDFPPHRGGIQRMMSHLASEFESLGERVVVVAPALTGSDSFDSLQRYRISRYAGWGRVGSFIAMIFHIVWAGSKSPKPTIVADSWFPAGIAVCCIPRVWLGRFAVLAHGTEVVNSRRGIRRRAMRYVFGRADRVVANSRYTRDLLVTAGVTGSIRVIYPGIDPDVVTPARSIVPTLLSVGRLVARKGFDTMIRAMPAILEKHPAARYEIVGAGPQRESLEALAALLKVSDNVSFLGSIGDDEMAMAYARAWLFCMPVRPDEHDVEGFGMVYLEAALAELAVIGGANSGAEDAIVHDQTGLLVDGTSMEAVVTAVLSLLSDPERARAMGIRGKDRALSRFTWQRSALEFSNMFQ